MFKRHRDQERKRSSTQEGMRQGPREGGKGWDAQHRCGVGPDREHASSRAEGEGRGVHPSRCVDSVELTSWRTLQTEAPAAPAFGLTDVPAHQEALPHSPPPFSILISQIQVVSFEPPREATGIRIDTHRPKNGVSLFYLKTVLHYHLQRQRQCSSLA